MFADPFSHRNNQNPKTLGHKRRAYAVQGARQWSKNVLTAGRRPYMSTFLCLGDEDLHRVRVAAFGNGQNGRFVEQE